MALHLAPVEVADIDLLTSRDDARRLFRADLVEPRKSPLFRSELFARRPLGPFTLEVMAGFHILHAGAWREFLPHTRCEVRFGEAVLYTPGFDGLIAICTLFGRPKDLARKRLLEEMERVKGIEPSS